MFEQNIFVKFFSLMLVVILLFPSAIQLAHTEDSHDHPVCTDFSTHMHETELDCSLCDFQVSIFAFDTEKPGQDLLNSQNFRQIHSAPKSLYLISSETTSLRGPPLLV